MTRKEIKGNPREQRQKEKQQMSSSYPPIIEFHSRKLWWGLLLPLPREVVTADISRCGNRGA